MKIKIPLFLMSIMSLGACSLQGPGWTHGQPLKDGSGAAVYDCRPLQGEEATIALKKSHKLFEDKYYKKIRASDAQREKNIADERAGKKFTREEVSAFNNNVLDLKNNMSTGTAALGCEFKGMLAEGSVSRN